jgi:tRNA 2-thiouridine synthesizing protein C
MSNLTSSSPTIIAASSKEQLLLEPFSIEGDYIVIQTTQAPYSTSASIDAFEAALAATNIGLQVVYIFVANGVFQLQGGQQNNAIKHKSVYKKLSALPLFDIECLFAQSSALSENMVDLAEVPLDIRTIDDHQIIELCKQAKHVLVF